MKRLLLLIFLATSLLAGFAQVTAKIEPIEMMIGEQAVVTLTVAGEDAGQVEWPLLQPRQQLIPGVEVIGTHHPTSNTFTITLTSFDGKLYHLPAFKVKVGGKEVQTNELALKVIDVEVDTTKMDQFFGPKGIQDNPFRWSDWAPSFWLSVLMLVLMGVGLYLYRLLRANKPIMARIRIVKRLLPHQKAMKEIEQIKADKMVTSENQKEYYTKLTDTLRKYIQERYGFSAMEMTSGEIIARLTTDGDQQALDELRQLFMTADLVKFAKYSTMINENDANLVSAIDFINQTKLENQPTEEVVKPELTEADARQQKQRRVLKAVIAAIAVACVGLLAYVGYSIYLLLL